MAVHQWKVEAETYELSGQLSANGIVRASFQKRYPHRKQRFEIFPSAWYLAILTDIRPGQVTVRGRGVSRDLRGNHAIFLPAFSVLDWDLGPGNFVIEVVKSEIDLGPEAPNRPVLFSFEDKIPETLVETRELLARLAPLMVLDRVESPSSVSRRTKQFLDAHFREPLSIGDVADQLRLSRSVMTRSFVQDYGPPPVVYRNTLRVFDALDLMAEKKWSVVEASVHAGFSDTSNFHRHFKRFVEHVPSAFQNRRPRNLPGTPGLSAS